MRLRMPAAAAAFVSLLTATTGLAVSPSVSSAEPAPVVRSHDAGVNAQDEALEALAAAQDLLQGEPHARRTHGRRAHATLVLRELALRLGDLPPEQREVARGILARPSDPEGSYYGVRYDVPSRERCTTNLCVHWVPSTRDAPPARDDDGDEIPDWVETTSTTLETAWRRIVGDLGYRAPRSDTDSTFHGPDHRLDVYLADLGGRGLYGFCTSDDPGLEAGRWNVSAYCVLDDDFSASQFAAPPVSTLRATAAHEFFHAVQYAYDVTEDLWLLEGTAAWVEDEVFDGVNDNLQFLWNSPLTEPGVSLDRPRHQYGAWIFWRFFAEYVGRSRGGDRSVVRQIWNRAAADGSDPGAYSLQAVRQVLDARGRSFPRVFADFGAVNRVSGSWYAEGRTYPRTPVARVHRLRKDAPATGWRVLSLDHLANQHVVLQPAASLTGRRTLRLSLDLPDRRRGSMATVTVHGSDGRVKRVPVRLGARGNGVVRVGFTRSRVSRVTLTVTNASSRYRCGQRTWLSCQGAALDDDLRFRYAARALAPRR